MDDGNGCAILDGAHLLVTIETTKWALPPTDLPRALLASFSRHRYQNTPLQQDHDIVQLISRSGDTSINGAFSSLLPSEQLTAALLRPPQTQRE